jgi:hypothetical protein
VLPDDYHPYHHHLSGQTLRCFNEDFFRNHTQTQVGGLGVVVMYRTLPLIQPGFAPRAAFPDARQLNLNLQQG